MNVSQTTGDVAKHRATQASIPSTTTLTLPKLTSSPTQITSLTATLSSTITDPKVTTELPSSGGISSSSTENTSRPAQTVSPSTSGKKSSGLSGGAAAGIAIGCLLVGALVAGLLVWFCLGKQKKRQRPRDQEASAAALMVSEKGTRSLDGGSPITLAIENGLPQPLEDKAISGEVSKISNSIKNHVQSFYHSGRVSPGLLDLDDIQALGANLPVSVGTLSTLLGNATTREIALRFSIAWVLVTRMQLHGQIGVTFLPPEVAQCAESISKVNRGSRVHSLFFAKWRTITAELMQSIYVRNPFSAGDPRNQSIAAAMEVLECILQPYADSRMDSSQRHRNLEEILKRAAGFAFTLFAQPSSWDFDWQDEQDVKSGSLCIFPALVQTADESGAPVMPPRPFNEAVVRRLDD
ncbi:hypothetical protein P154DRAFT_439825 [Amniculicola lignicola CBS 123094]|uniref:Uncharacterized protein n=1 Tax=Amniculicola lignicola CBS 123094 TaxID=1392246 RepID=A0A6A5WG40_9PLEO|nr:hypothetical protein P154DRAFT_439825 [Amniculicola lignicola CBS 123094]